MEYYGDRYSASDSSLFKNFIRFYEAMPENQPRFGYLLTIQNHGRWDRNSPDKDTVHIQDSHGLSEYEQQINEYLTCIDQTDVFVDEMIQYFSDSSREVIVYMVGDHCPSLIRNWDLGNSAEIALKKRQVPYFIWSNGDIDESTLPENRNIDMCTLTPLMLRAAAKQLSPYYTQVLQCSEYVQSLTVQEEMTIENHLVYIDKYGVVQDAYSGTTDAELVKYYYFMEYNGLIKEKLDSLFDP